MGNKGAKKEKSEVMENQQAKVGHSRINDVTITRTNNHNEYMSAQFPIGDAKSFTAWKKELKSSPGQKSDFSLHPKKYDMKKQSMCGKTGNAKIQYDNYSYTLRDEINNRRRSNGAKFEEPELWYLLNALSDVGEKFHQKNMKAGDIRPENVFVNDDGRVKIATQHSWPQQTTNYQKFLYDHEPTLLAPEEINDVQIGRDHSTANLQAAESFSIGMTALDSALLEDSKQIYNKNSFDYELLEHKRKNLLFEPKYSELLKLVINNLTSPEFGKRLTAKELKAFLRPNEQRINSLQNFSVNDIPYKLKQTAGQMGASKTSQIPQTSSSYIPNTQTYTQSGYNPLNVQTYTQSKYVPPNVAQSNLSPRNSDQTKYRMTLAQIQEKVSRSRANNPL